jgi:hypothetical protein
MPLVDDVVKAYQTCSESKAETDGATGENHLVAKARRRGAVAAEADEPAEEARDEADGAIIKTKNLLVV